MNTYLQPPPVLGNTAPRGLNRLPVPFLVVYSRAPIPILTRPGLTKRSLDPLRLEHHLSRLGRFHQTSNQGKVLHARPWSCGVNHLPPGALHHGHGGMGFR